MIQLFQPKYEVAECLAEIQKSLESGWTGTGPKCLELEKKWCEYTGAKYSQYLNSATSALHIALRLCDLPTGSKVATTSLTFVSTNAVILYEGHIPVFCDINPNTMSLASKSAIKAVEDGCKAIIWVHYGGSVAPDFYNFMEEVKLRGLDVKVIEDCAHAGGASYTNGDKVGSRTDTFSCFHYQAVKNAPTSDSGMLCLPTAEFHTRAQHLSWLGIDKNTYSRTDVKGEKEIYSWKYTVPELGWKYNGNDIVTSIGLVQLKYLSRDNDYRNLINHWYFCELSNVPDIELMFHDMGSSSISWS